MARTYNLRLGRFRLAACGQGPTGSAHFPAGAGGAQERAGAGEASPAGWRTIACGDTSARLGASARLRLRTCGRAPARHDDRAMLTEFRQVKQEPGGRRRWFESDGLELIVWYGADGRIAGFQLCYGSGARAEHALTWRRGTGFAHHFVDTGDDQPQRNETPVLLPDGAVPWVDLTALFVARSPTLDADLREEILQRLAAQQ